MLTRVVSVLRQQPLFITGSVKLNLKQTLIGYRVGNYNISPKCDFHYKGNYSGHLQPNLSF